MIRNFAYFLVIVSFSISTLAEPGHDVLLRGPGVDEAEYQAYLQVTGSYRSYADEFRRQHKKSKARQELLRKLSDAQEIFFSAKLDQAAAAYKEVVGFSLLADWEYSERKAIHQAFLKLAQMAKTEQEKDQWVTQAIEFSADIEADRQLNPPPLVERYETLRSSYKFVVFRPIEGLSDFEMIVVNGREYKINPQTKISLSRGPQRITLISNHFRPVTQVLSGPDVIHWQAPRAAMVAGDCENPRWMAKDISQWKIYFNSSCVKSGDSSVEPTLADLRPQQPPLSSSMTTPPQKPKSSFSWLENKWVWIGLGAVTAAWLYQSNQRSSSGKAETATVKEGF